MPQISVVLPVYNVEEYLRQCLDSLANQTFEDFEVASDTAPADSDPDDACSTDGKPSYQSQRCMESDHVHSGTYICSYFRYVIPTDVLRR